MVPLVVEAARGSPGFESLLADPPGDKAVIDIDSGQCVDCYDCDFNCEECDS